MPSRWIEYTMMRVNVARWFLSLLFGAFLAWAVADRISMKRRTQRAIPTLPATKANDIIAVIGGLAVYVIMVVWAHQWLFGVAPV